MEERRSLQDRRSNWTDALIALRLSDSTIMILAEEWTDRIRESAGGDRDLGRRLLLDLILDVRERAGRP